MAPKRLSNDSDALVLPAVSRFSTCSASSLSFTSTSSIYIPFTNTLRDVRILSTTTERTENPSSRPLPSSLLDLVPPPSPIFRVLVLWLRALPLHSFRKFLCPRVLWRFENHEKSEKSKIL